MFWILLLLRFCSSYLTFHLSYGCTTPCGCGVRIYPASHCACRKRRLSSLGPPPQGEGVPICSLRMEKLRSPIPGESPLSKPAVGRSIALHALPAYRASVYRVSAFSAHVQLHFLYISSIFNGGMCRLSSESEFLLAVGIHFVSPSYGPSWLTGRKTSSIYVLYMSIYVCMYVCIYLSIYLSRSEAGGFMMSPPSLESQRCQFDPTFLYLLFCLPSPAAISVLSFSAFDPFS